MIDLHWTIAEYLDLPDAVVDTLPVEEVRFLYRLTEAFNEHTRATMPEPVTPEQIMRRCLRVFAPHPLH